MLPYTRCWFCSVATWDPVWYHSEFFSLGLVHGHGCVHVCCEFEPRYAEVSFNTEDDLSSSPTLWDGEASSLGFI